MDRSVRTGRESDEARARILGAAEERFRRVGHHRTSVADIAAELGMSPANIYRFFPSRNAIDESICGRLLNELADFAFAIARRDAPAAEKLEELLSTVHHHSKMTLVTAKPMHDLIVAATQENWPIIKAHIERMETIFEAIIRGGAQAGQFDVEDAAEAARAVRSAFMPFFHPILIEHCVVHGEDTEAGLRDQIRFILKALGKSG
ncbi:MULTISPECIES: TetR family transcriptional regulator [unclassified Bradyrhizobium]|uniref:TetR/AcrR family transcriptional regulator n=1 Tax=unclassified Bradyrhizobium TaxID=2631580 RepID=UPI001FFEEC22|nr:MULTISPECIES: TetR family transcriptional regulator [unclassified Bradyrhizobium]MCK1267603.1 TetR family transcriptional regulator [Bradyrhizobium sp. 84]MCK1374337.1 TetR family transcriptional regulator [Bradyrhizobium sp. 49]MCK1413729.1 TetR family transcriptional regulator [Bradyrhizobium sp. CW4]MCK1427246.1 TetR family transcriptional regulator [Bradyrhizobium sp. 87]MCK1497864.1 TetR family transcriptional regulator [Bradyrhizobium sp. 188]